MATGDASGQIRRGPTQEELTEELEYAFDEQGVSTELLRDMKRVETNALTLRRKGAGAALEGEPRIAALRFLSSLVGMVGLQPSKSWFEVVTLLDVYCYQCPGGVDIGLLPATCVALVRMLKKTDMATLSMRGSNLSVHANQLSGLLQKLGYCAPQVTEEQLNQQETAVLNALGWKINLPSVQSWMAMFCTRFNTFTCGLYFKTLEWVWQQSMFYASALLMRQAASSGLPPRRLAAGLLGLNFVHARLLPLEALRPEKVCGQEWEQIVVQSQLKGGDVPTCASPPNVALQVLQLLRLTTDFSLVELQESCKLVASTLRGAVAEFQAMQQRAQQEAPPGAIP